MQYGGVLLFICFFLFGAHMARADGRYLDSMRNVLLTTGDPALQSDIHTRISFYYLSTNLDSSEYYADRGIAVAKAAGNDTSVAKGLICKSFALDAKGEIGEALAVIDSALQIAESQRKPRALFSAYNIKAKLLKAKSRYADALTYYMKAADLAEQENSDEMKSRSYNNLGVYYLSRRDLEMAEDYHFKSLEVRKKIGFKPDIATSYENIGIVYREKKEYDKALEYYFKALEINIGIGDSSSIAYSYNDIGAAYSLKGDYGKAEHYLLEAIRIRTHINELEDLPYTYNYLGENYERKGDLLKAQFFLRKALQATIGNENNKQQIESLKSISEFFYRNKQFDSAYHYAIKHQMLSDSLRAKDNEELISHLTTRFETVKKDRIIQAQNFDISRKNFWIIGLTALLFALVVLFIFAYKFYKQRQSQKLQMALMKQQDIAANAVIEAEENERKRIAADLHDGIGQMLTAVKLNLEAIQDNETITPQSKNEVLRNILHMVDDSCKEVRSVSHNIMPNALIKSGLGNALKDFVEKMESRNIAIHLNSYGLNETLESKTEIIVYRIIQECVNNVIKHAKATRLDISIIMDQDGLQLSIEDNGIGFNKNNLEHESGIGMKNVKARVDFLKGSLEIDSKPGRGTLMAIFIPNPQRKQP